MAECDGTTITFEKAAYADWTLSENQDSLAPTVIITRKDIQSLFNIAQEEAYSGNSGSPIGTLWARSTTADADPTDYVNFVSMHSSGGGGGGGGDGNTGPQSLVGETVSLYLPDYNIYFDVEFTLYGGGNSGGAFAWERSCVKEEIVGCQVATACNYNDSATLAGDCTYTDGICEGCSGETDGSGTVVDNDADDDSVCDADEPTGCMDAAICNYNSVAEFDDGSCLAALDGVCETCSGETDGSGIIVDNDADDDGVCDELSSNFTMEPSNFSIVSIYPNPFNPSTTISFTLDQFSNVEMQIYNLRGELIENLLNERLNVGRHSILWNADSYSVGTYLLQIKAGHQVDTQKLVLIK